MPPEDNDSALILDTAYDSAELEFDRIMNSEPISVIDLPSIFD